MNRRSKLTSRNAVYRATGRMYAETRAAAKSNARNYFRRKSSGGNGG